MKGRWEGLKKGWKKKHRNERRKRNKDKIKILLNN